MYEVLTWQLLHPFLSWWHGQYFSLNDLAKNTKKYNILFLMIIMIDTVPACILAALYGELSTH